MALSDRTEPRNRMKLYKESKYKGHHTKADYFGIAVVLHESLDLIDLLKVPSDPLKVVALAGSPRDLLKILANESPDDNRDFDKP